MLDLTPNPAIGARRPETRVNRHLISGEFTPSRARPGTSCQEEVPGQARDGDSWLDHLSPSHGNVVSRS